MTTDDERRRVAERLREYGARPYPNFNVALIARAMGIDIIKFTGHKHGDSELFSRLADLIEPTNLHYSPDSADSATEAPAEPSLDREALLALADKLDSLGLNGFSSGWSSGAVNVGSFARRIREACGEVAS